MAKKESIYNKLKSTIMKQGENLFPLRGCYCNMQWEEQIPKINWDEVLRYMNSIPYQGD